MSKEEELKKMLKETYDKDNSFNKGKLNYVSWELGFQRGMEYQQKLDNRVIGLHEKGQALIDKFLKRMK